MSDAPKVNVLLNLPTLSPEGRQLAETLLKVDLQFAHGTKALEDTTLDDVRQEAQRLATLVDSDDRAQQIERTLTAFFALARDSRGVCEFALVAADALAQIPGQLKSLKNAEVQAVRPIGRDE